MDNQKIIIGYWDLRGIVAPIKYLLEYLKVDYEDKYHFYGEAPTFNKDSWLLVKDHLGFDFPNLPYLIQGDFKLTESQAIYRYICRKYGPELLGKTIADKAIVDMVMSVTVDLRTTSYEMIYDTGDRKAMQDLGYGVFEKISRFLGDKQFIAGDYLTFPDFFIYENIELFDYVCDQGGLCKRFPNLATYRERIANLPGVKEYLGSDRSLKRPFNGKRALINN